jgi:hypothetical protein
LDTLFLPEEIFFFELRRFDPWNTRILWIKAWKPHDSRVVAVVALLTTMLSCPFKYDSEGIKQVFDLVGKLIVIVSPWEKLVPP